MKTLWGIADSEQLDALAMLLEEYAKEMGYLWRPSGARSFGRARHVPVQRGRDRTSGHQATIGF